MKKNLFLIFLLSSCSLFAKENRFDLHLSQGDIFEQVVLKKLKGDTLFYIYENDERRININELAKMYKIRQSKFWKGAGIGLVGGAVIGGIAGRASYKKPEQDGSFYIDFGPGLSTFGGAVVGGGSGFLIGGIIGAKRGGSKKEYDFSIMTLTQTRMVINDGDQA